MTDTHATSQSTTPELSKGGSFSKVNVLDCLSLEAEVEGEASANESEDTLSVHSSDAEWLDDEEQQDTDSVRCISYHDESRNQCGFPLTDELDGSFAYTPKGHVTDIDQDSLYQGRFTTCLLGRKLFMCWSPTPYNLHDYAKLQDRLEVILCNRSGVNYMPPGILHAVLSLDSSATFAYDVGYSSMLRDVVRPAKWEVEHAGVLQTQGPPINT
ncbi:hypothetical protein OC845_006177 [Tilletia horrida]|nr:hypothetical protein OC845_006177 [Tilletia horrida]